MERSGCCHRKHPLADGGSHYRGHGYRLGERCKRRHVCRLEFRTDVRAGHESRTDPLELRERGLSNRRAIDRGRHPLLGIRLPKYPSWNRKQQSLRVLSGRLEGSRRALRTIRTTTTTPTITTSKSDRLGVIASINDVSCDSRSC